MKKRGIVVVFVCLMSVVQSYAQKQQWNADTILKRAHAVEATYRSVQANLKMITVRDSSVASKTGVLAWQKDRMNISYYDGEEKLTFQIIQLLDTMWIYDAELNRMDVQIVAKGKGGNEGTGLFYPSSNSYTRPQLKEIIGDSIAIVTVYPAFPEKVSWIRMEIRINLKTYVYVGYTTFHNDGSQTTFLLEYKSINAPLSPELFRFDPANYPKGLEILDHRNE